MSIKIIVHPSLASDLYVKMSQVMQEIDMLVVCKAGDEIVGHLPRNISTMCSIFIWCGEIIYCIVSGRRKYSSDLPQGGMEIQENFAGKLSQLEVNLRKFSTVNDLHYTV